MFTRYGHRPRGRRQGVGQGGRQRVRRLLTRDRSTSLLFPSNQFTGSALLPEDVNTAVLRYRRDVGGRGAVGVVYTGRQGDEYQNHVGGLDGFFQLSPTKYLRFQASRSQTEYPDTVSTVFAQPEGGFGGNNFYAQLTHASRNWFASVDVQEVGKDYRADAGFITRSDLRGGVLQVQRTLWGRPNLWYRRIALFGYAERFQDHDGRMTDLGFAFVPSYDGPLQTFVSAGFGYNKKFFRGETYELFDVRPTFQIRPSQRVSITVQGRFGEDIDVTNNRKANIFQLAPGVDLRLGRRLSLGVSHTLRRLETQDDHATAPSERILNVGLSQARALYHFNVRTFVRAIVQYQDADFTPTLYSVPVPAEQRTLFAQLMFAYKVNPQTVVFAGYTDDRLGIETIDLTPTGRTFFLKLGYNWQP